MWHKKCISHTGFNSVYNSSDRLTLLLVSVIVNQKCCVVFYDCVACEASGVYKCPGTDRCILAEYVCDDDNDCGNWADERNCCE